MARPTRPPHDGRRATGAPRSGWARSRLAHNVRVRTIEHRRHTMRAKPGQHLTQEGVDLARRVGDGMGRFDRVVTSRVPRAYETAIAMGYAVDEQVEALSATPAGVGAEGDWRGRGAAVAPPPPPPGGGGRPPP